MYPEYNKYKTVTEHLTSDKETDFAINNCVTLPLVDGTSLKNIIPISIAEGLDPDAEKPQTTLFLMFLSQENELVEIPISEVQGLRVSQGLPGSELAGKLLVQATYYSPKDGGKMENEPRNFQVARICFGIQEKHAEAGETKPDYYLEGPDQQYLLKGNTMGESLRKFPLWRLGVYGQALTQVPNFIGAK